MSREASSPAGQLANGFWSRIALSCGQGGRPFGVSVVVVWLPTRAELAGAGSSAVEAKQVGVDSQGGIRQKREREVVRWALSSRWTGWVGEVGKAVVRARCGDRRRSRGGEGEKQRQQRGAVRISSALTFLLGSSPGGQTLKKGGRTLCRGCAILEAESRIHDRQARRLVLKGAVQCTMRAPGELPGSVSVGTISTQRPERRPSQGGGEGAPLPRCTFLFEQMRAYDYERV